MATNEIDTDAAWVEWAKRALLAGSSPAAVARHLRDYVARRDGTRPTVDHAQRTGA
jgi:hypothetical protein